MANSSIQPKTLQSHLCNHNRAKGKKEREKRETEDDIPALPLRLRNLRPEKRPRSFLEPVRVESRNPVDASKSWPTSVRVFVVGPYPKFSLPHLGGFPCEICSNSAEETSSVEGFPFGHFIVLTSRHGWVVTAGSWTWSSFPEPSFCHLDSACNFASRLLLKVWIAHLKNTGI